MEALRDKQLQNYLKNKDKKSGEVKEKNEQVINELVEKIKELNGKPHLNQKENQVDIIKDLNKQSQKIIKIKVTNNMIKIANLDFTFLPNIYFRL